MNFYWQFIKSFAEVAAPLTRLIDNILWWWIKQKQKTFKKLKTAFVSESILVLFNLDHKTILKADLSEYTTEGIFFQFDNKGILRSYIYFSKKNSSAECNYKIHDKKLLIVIHCLQKWDTELHSVKEFTIIINYKNLKYFMQFQKLSKQYVKWLIFLSRYNITMQYCSELKNSYTDTLS